MNPPNISPTVKSPLGVRIVSAVVDLIYPPCCPYCREDIHSPIEKFFLCPDCRGRLLERDDILFCHRCAAPLPMVTISRDDEPAAEPTKIALACRYCRGRRWRFESVAALGRYEGDLGRAILRMKHAREAPLAHAMGYALGEKLAVEWADLPIDWIVPVPMHWRRRFMRNANSPDLLAQAVARRLGRPATMDVLRRAKHTPEQHRLSPEQRRKNLRGAFRVRRGCDLKGVTIGLIDDVMTTGATLHEAAKTLRRAGAEKVYAAVVARGIGSR